MNGKDSELGIRDSRERRTEIANRMNRFQHAVRAEHWRAAMSNAPFHSCHEAWAVLFEEVEELWEEVRKKRTDRDLFKLYRELQQVAAMAQRFACELVIPYLPDMPDDFRLWALNDCETVAAPTMETAIDFLVKQTGVDREELLDDPKEIPRDQWDAHVLNDEDGTQLTYREWALHNAAQSVEMPYTFATNE